MQPPCTRERRRPGSGAPHKTGREPVWLRDHQQSVAFRKIASSSRTHVHRCLQGVSVQVVRPELFSAGGAQGLSVADVDRIEQKAPKTWKGSGRSARSTASQHQLATARSRAVHAKLVGRGCSPRCTRRAGESRNAAPQCLQSASRQPWRPRPTRAVLLVLVKHGQGPLSSYRQSPGEGPQTSPVTVAVIPGTPR